MRSPSRTTLARSLLLALASALPSGAHAQSAGAVFVGTNHNNTNATSQSEPANEVVMYDRAADGRLTLVGRFGTGGQGSGPSIRFAGDGLGSSHSIQLSSDRRFLLVTNAGSNSISVFRIGRSSLRLVSVTPTDPFPNSVAVRGDLVYVLTSIGGGSIQGFRLDGRRGTLSPIPNSTRGLGANQDGFRPDTLFNPTQVSFTPDGQQLVVTIKDGPVVGAIAGATPTGPGRVLVFRVDRDGRPSAQPTRTNFANLGPFGFSFDRKGNLIIAMFVGGPFLSSSVRSLRIQPNGTLVSISSVDNTQLDSCWFENNGRYGWTANYTSGTISSYRIANNGAVTLVSAVAARPDRPDNRQGTTPLDLGVSPDGRFLYNVLPGSGRVAGYRINGDGSLGDVGEFPGLPVTVDGDSAPFEYGPGGSPAGIAVL